MKYKVRMKKNKLNYPLVKHALSRKTAPTAKHPQLIKLAKLATLSLHFALTVDTSFEFYRFKSLAAVF